MASLLEITRNTNKHPILDEQEREATYGKPQKPYLRASLSPAQRTGTNKHAAVSPRPKNADPTTRPGPAYRSTDDFDVNIEQPVAPAQPHKRRSVVAQTAQPQRTASSKYRLVEDNVPARQEQQTQKRGIASWICIGLGAIVIVYSIVYLIIAAWIATSNAVVYGSQTHTSYTQVAVKGNTKTTTASNLTVITTNLNGTIYITVIQAGHPTTYTGPTLKADAWNNDLSGVTATARVTDQGVIVVDLMGTMNYFHPLYVRPTMQFSLVPDKAGYKVVMQP